MCRGQNNKSIKNFNSLHRGLRRQMLGCCSSAVPQHTEITNASMKETVRLG